MFSTTESPEITTAFQRETQAWQRTIFFRPWFEDKTVADLSQSTAVGADYASVFAASVELFANPDELDGLRENPPFGIVPASPETASVSGYDVVLCFDALNRASDPSALLEHLAACDGQLAIGYEPDGKWSFEGFSSAIESAFEGRPVRFLFQQPDWPYGLEPDNVEGAIYWIAAIGETQPIEWPTIGFSIPTVDNAECLKDAMLGLSRTYPGTMRFAVVANGSSPETIETLVPFIAEFGQRATLLIEPVNLGYGQGCNRGLDYLVSETSCDLVGVVNDDVIPDIDCVCEMVAGLKGLHALGLNPGAIAPVSNYVHGPQQVDIGPYDDYVQMLAKADAYHRRKHSSVTQSRQIRGLCLLFSPECLETVGGFDPRFGIGNFEDDDHNLRCHLAGFSLWIADGAFLYHHGSTTFRKLDVDYQANIRRNAEAMAEKWGLDQAEKWQQIAFLPEGVGLKVDLGSWKSLEHRHPITINGEEVDLIHQATDMEFAAWMIQTLRSRPRDVRRKLLDALDGAA